MMKDPQDIQPRPSNPAQSVILAAGPYQVEISVLAADLFRFRMVRGNVLHPARSWAVHKTDWPHVEVSAQRSARGVTIGTSEGQFTFSYAGAGWEIRDRHGLVLFSSPPGCTSFTPQGPRVRLLLDENEAIHGLGESSGTFNKRGLIREFWNIDVGGHTRAVHAALRNMYLSIPFALSLRHGRAAGLFWDNPGRQTWDIGQTVGNRWEMSAAEGEVDLYFFLGPSCQEVAEAYTELTGRMPLPPRWSLGYQQCRYSYETRQRVEEIARTFRRKRIPCDALYFDIHYMDAYRVFTFGKSFPKPQELISRLSKQGFKVVTIVDPGVKDDPKFPVLRRGLAEGAFVKGPGGKKDYLGKVWPGRVRFPDFLHAPTRDWWAAEQARFQQLGIAGIWNDMNEPADFSAPGKDLPGDCVHQTDAGLVRHAAVHNVYGSEMARASYQGALAAAPEQRPFIITRAGYAGLQKHALVWTGDNDSTWEHLADSVQMLLNLSMSGVAFCGADVGGFHHNTTGELLARWTQLAAFTPFFRNHSNIGTIDQEPWAFGPRIENICRNYIQLRYQLMPYLYGLFVEAFRFGTPIMRPMFWHHQNDPRAAAAGDQFLLGRDLLVAPILRQGATARSVYLPTGIWFNFWTGESLRGGRHVLAEADLEELPLYVRAGAIVPMTSVQQYMGEKMDRVVNLHIWPGPRGGLHWYEDDGKSFQYEQGGYYERSIELSLRKRTMALHFGAPSGKFRTQVKRWRILLRSATRAVQPKVADIEIPAVFDSELGCAAFELPNVPEALQISWK